MEMQPGIPVVWKHQPGHRALALLYLPKRLGLPHSAALLRVGLGWFPGLEKIEGAFLD